MQENITDMMKDYHAQFEALTHTVDKNNQELDQLRHELTQSQARFFTLRTQ